jgi:ABC-type lipoprotein export system ATPase subunit
MTEPLVAVRDVFCVHRTPEGDAAALQGATLEVAKGEIVCVLGPSGAGKTTLLSVIAGHQVPAAGSVLVAGQDIGRLPEAARARIRHQMIGVMAQSAGSVLPDDLEAHDAISLPLALRGIGRAARRRRAEELLVAVRLSDVARARPHELSGGERQRVALCAALAHRPALLLADEPTAELDAAAARTVHDALAALARAEGTTVVMVSHDPATAALAQRTVQIADGRLAEDGRDGQAAVVVGRGGWLRLPAGILAQAGIGDRVAVQVHEGQVVLTSVTVQSRPSRNGRPAPAPTPPPAAAAAEISVQSVTATLGSGRTRRQVFTDLSCAPPPGRLTVIAGPSGSGKTTLLRLLVGLARAARGTVHVDEVELGALDAEGLAAL